MDKQKMSGACLFKDYSVELTCLLQRRSHKPYREWKKSQKWIRRERRRRMAYKKGKVKK